MAIKYLQGLEYMDSIDINEEEHLRCIIKAIETHKRSLISQLEEASNPRHINTLKSEMTVYDQWMNDCKAKLFDNMN